MTPDAKPEISVVLCTVDRPEYLRLAVASLGNQTIPDTRFEVIVVDNGTGDTTRSTLGDAAMDMPNLRTVHEPVAGLSQARNRGTREAAGDIVLFMDDDAVAEPQLLEAHLRRLADPDGPVATGGRIYLRWPGPCPSWVPASQESYYSGLDLGDTTRAMPFPEYPYGANMAIRRDLLLELGGFSVELGRRGRNLISGEEKDLFLRVSKAGGRVAYVPDAIVHHHVLPERVSRRWLLRRSWAQGRSDITMSLVADGPMPARRLLARAGLHAWRAGTHAGALVGATAARREDSQRTRCASQSLRWLGAAYQGVTAAWSRGRSADR